MAEARAALVIRSIVQEVVAICAEAGHSDIDENIASFMVKSVVLDPRSKFSDDLNLTKEAVTELIDECVSRLTAKESMSLGTIRMQLSFQKKYASLDDIKSLYRAQRMNRYEQIESEILSTPPTNVQDHIEELYSKIIESNLLRLNMGIHSEFNAIRECTAALESVLPPVELGVFMSLSHSEKRKQLEDISMIVGGIRLFNKSTGKGGNEIPDHATGVANKINALLRRSYDDLCKFGQLAGVFAVCQELAPEQAEEFLLAAANARQYQTYLTILHTDTMLLAEQAGRAGQSYNKHLGALNSAIQSKTAVPTDQVYPHFIELADTYMALDICDTALDRMTVLHDELSNLMDVLVQFVEANEKSCMTANEQQNLDYQRVYNEFVSHIRARSIAAAMQIAPDVESAKNAFPDQGAKAISTPPKLEPRTIQGPGEKGEVILLLPDVAHKYESIQLNLGGLCAYSASLNPPILRLADRKLGILQYDNRYYGFTNQSTADEFATNPDALIKQTLDNAKKYPELLELLQLHDYFSSFSPSGETTITVPQASRKPLKCDGGAQTDTHPIESNIVRNYDHSEWELRKKALHLANLRQKKTHSTQTDRSNYRRETATQVYVPKESTTQTRKSSGTNVPKPVTYIRGLRGHHGRKAQPVEVVDLTTDIGGLALNVRGLTGTRGRAKLP